MCGSIRGADHLSRLEMAEQKDVVNSSVISEKDTMDSPATVDQRPELPDCSSAQLTEEIKRKIRKPTRFSGFV